MTKMIYLFFLISYQVTPDLLAQQDNLDGRIYLCCFLCFSLLCCCGSLLFCKWLYFPNLKEKFSFSFLVFGQYPGCSGTTPCSWLRNCSCCALSIVQCQEPNLCFQHAKQHHWLFERSFWTQTKTFSRSKFSILSSITYNMQITHDY